MFTVCNKCGADCFGFLKSQLAAVFFLNLKTRELTFREFSKVSTILDYATVFTRYYIYGAGFLEISEFPDGALLVAANMYVCTYVYTHLNHIYIHTYIHIYIYI